MADRIKPPAYNTAKGYERYKQELLAWKEITATVKKKQGILIALSLPETDDTGIRERVFDELKIEDLSKEDGLETLMTYMDKQLGKDDLSDCLEKYEQFDSFERSDQVSMAEYVSKFEQHYNRILKLKMTLPPEVLAFTLLKKAHITKGEKMLVLTGMDYSKKDQLFEQAKASLLKFKGEQGGGATSLTDITPAAVKLEPAYMNETDEAFWNSGYRRGYGHNYRGNRGRPWSRGAHQGYNKFQKGTNDKRINPKGPDGKLLLCKSCGSFRHFVADCPDSYENRNVNVVQENKGETALFTKDIGIEDIVLFTGFKEKSQNFTVEASRCAVLDSACSSTVCGADWLDDYLASLDVNNKSKVRKTDSSKRFKFGGGEILKSLGSIEIPAIVATKNVTIKTDVVESDIPLLLSKQAMKKANVKLDLENDTAEIFGKVISLNETTSGHYCVPINEEVDITDVNSVCAVNLGENEQIKYKTVVKLHRQFAHPSIERFTALLKDAGVWKSVQNIVAQIYKNCQLCKVYKKTPVKPAVCMPMATTFNEKVCMDLKKWGDKWILHLIDMFTRFSISVFIPRKKPSNVIDRIMMCWVGIFGTMKCVLSDNGGEFSSDEMREVCSILNVEKLTTAAESPFQNGLCERNHAVVDNMLLKMQSQCPGTPQDVLLGWANMAKNSLQMWHGFSSYQLVFGQNPNLPNVMTAELPALEGTSTSEMLVQHLNGLHAARKAFIESEADERIRRALRCKIRASEECYGPGDLIYYKRQANDRWLGPAKVIFQDGKVIFIRHGATFVRVSPNRISLASGRCVTITNTDEQKSTTRGDEFEDDYDSNDFEDSSSENNTDIQSKQNANVKLTKDEKIKYKLNNADEWTNATITGRGGKISGINKNWYNIKDLTGNKKSLNLDSVQWEKDNDELEEVNVILIPKNQHNDISCIKAKQTELEKLKNFDTYEEVKDTGQFRISTTWVLWHKGDEVRARLVARGYEDEQSYPKDSPTIGKSALKVVLTIAASKSWQIKTTDIKSAFLQGKKMDREVHLAPPKEAKITGIIWKLKHCIYGLNDAARHFYHSVQELLLSVGCRQCQLDPALFSYIKEKTLIGIVACHVDDFLHAGTECFEEVVMSPLRRRFLAGKIESSEFRYVGFDIVQDEYGIIMDHSDYVSGVDDGVIDPQRATNKQDFLTAEEQTLLRQLVGRLNWAVQGSRPDLGFEMIQLSTKLKQGTVGDLIQAIKCIRKMKTVTSIVRFSNLGSSQNWKMVVYSDASHANLDRIGSVAAHVLFMVNGKGSVCPLSWKSTKIKRVVKSTLSAEMLSLQEAIEDAIYVREMVTTVMNFTQAIPITAYVDNKSVIQALRSTKMVDDKRLRLDIASIKENLIKNDIHEINWVSGDKQLANCMTKHGASPYDLMKVITNGKLVDIF